MKKLHQSMPKGVKALYLIHIFSTFSFAILYSSLSLYLTENLGLSSRNSITLVGLFLAFNYALHLFGGLLGGRYLSNRSLFFITTIIQSLGIFVLIFGKTSLLYLGLSLFLVGCGLNTTCRNTMLTQRFQPDDPRQTQAFFFSYAAMNLGFFVGYLCSGFYDYSNQYQELFCISLITNLLTLGLMLINWVNLADLPLEKKTHLSKKLTATASIFLFIPLMIAGFYSAQLSNALILILSLLASCGLLFLAKREKNAINQKKIYVFLILTISSIIFWMIYFTGPMGITLFIKHNVNKSILGYELATQWISNLNPILIIIGAPLLSLLIRSLEAKGWQFSIFKQFILSFLMLSLSFCFLSLGVFFADSQGFSALIWIFLHLLSQSLAELFIGPVGYAMIGKIAPAPLQGIFMGIWMMVSGLSASLAHYTSKAMLTTTTAIDPLMTNDDFFLVFTQLSLLAFACALFLSIISRAIKGLINQAGKQAPKFTLEKPATEQPC